MPSLVTLSEAKAALGIAGTDSDAKISAILSGAGAAVEAYAGRAFTQAEVTERHAGGYRGLYLRRRPVASIASVTDLHTGDEAPAADYSLDAETGILYRVRLGERWAAIGSASPLTPNSEPGVPRSIDRWSVTYTGGPVAAPDDVKLAVFDLIGAILRGQGGLSSERDGDYSYTLAASASAMPPRAAQILSAYRASVI